MRDAPEIVYSGSLVLSGAMTAVAVRGSDDSLAGRTAHLSAAPKERTRLHGLLVGIAAFITVASVLLSGLLVVIKLILAQTPVIFILHSGLALLVAAIPISMHLVVTSAFVLASRKLLNVGVVVSRFNAIEQMAAMQIALLDKTGTMTQNKLQLTEPVLGDGVTEAELLQYAHLASSTDVPDAIDKVIATAVSESGASRDYRVIEYESFTSVRKRSSAIISHLRDGTQFEVVKGAPQVMLETCKFSPEITERVAAAVADHAARGLRCLVVALRPRSASATAAGAAEEPIWRFLGMLSMKDALHEESSDLVKGFGSLGVKVKMVTGDGLEIGRETCRLVGMGTNAITRKQLIELTSSEVAVQNSKFMAIDAFTEVFPEDKYNIVATYQRMGCVVGMTGDGINDCPALRVADVGIAVKGASPATIMAADMIVAGTKLSVVRNAILECRAAVERLKNYLMFRVNCTFVILFWGFFGSLSIGFGFPPLAYVCMAWANNLAILTIITDTTLVPRKPTKWDPQMFPLISIVLVLSCLEIFALYAMAMHGALLFSPFATIGQVRMSIFLGMTLLQQWAVFVIRSPCMVLAADAPQPSLFMLLSVSFVAFVATVLAAFWPFGAGLEPIGWNDIVQVWSITVLFFFVKDVLKVFFVWLLTALAIREPQREAYAGTERKTVRYESANISMLDKLFDALFIAGLVASLGTLLSSTSSPGSSLIDIFLHWLPLFFTWASYEGFAVRFGHVGWLSFLYLIAAVCFYGSLMHLSACRLSSFSTSDAPFACAGFALFLGLGRLTISAAWLVPALSAPRGRAYLMWRVLGALMPGVLYFACVFVRNNWILLPVFWCVALGLDMFLSLVPSSFAWQQSEWPRPTRYTEERYGMLYAVALSCVALSALAAGERL